MRIALCARISLAYLRINSCNYIVKINFFRILDMIGMDPKYLELEITESTIMQNEMESSKMLRDLKS